MTKPQFEWQRTWDGTQPPVEAPEASTVRERFRELAGGLIEKHVKIMRLQPEGQYINLSVPSAPPIVHAMVDMRNGWTPEKCLPSIRLVREVPRRQDWHPVLQTARIASWYFLNDKRLVVRQDFDTRSKEDILAANEEVSPPTTPLEAITSLTDYVQNRTRAFEADLELGFERQPIDMDEMNALENYMRLAVPLQASVNN